jgi:hypothetical protein
MQNFDHNIGFWEKRQFFRRKLAKIAENCDHKIDPNWANGSFSKITKVAKIFLWYITALIQGAQTNNLFITFYFHRYKYLI